MASAIRRFTVSLNAPASEGDSIQDINTLNDFLPTEFQSTRPFQFNQGYPYQGSNLLNYFQDPDTQYLPPRDVPIYVNSGEPQENEPYPSQTGGGSTTTLTEAKGIIETVIVPTSTSSGSLFQIDIRIRNLGGKGAKFSGRVTIPSLNIDSEPTGGVYLSGYTRGSILKTLRMPVDAELNKLFPATIELLRLDTVTGQIVDDTEYSTIPGPNTAVPPTPDPTGVTKYYKLVRYKCDPLTTLYTKAQLEAYGIQILDYFANPSDIITCTACGCLHGWIVVKVNMTNVNVDIILRSLGFVEGYDVPTGGTPTPTPTGTATITIPTSRHDGDSIKVEGSGFNPNEQVKITINWIMESNKSEYNGKVDTRSKIITASSTGTFSTSTYTKEVPSGVTGTATITAVGLTSNKQDSKTLQIL